MEANEMDVLVTLFDAYENRNYPIVPAERAQDSL